jgi:hypothetical protein
MGPETAFVIGGMLGAGSVLALSAFSKWWNADINAHVIAHAQADEWIRRKAQHEEKARRLAAAQCHSEPLREETCDTDFSSPYGIRVHNNHIHGNTFTMPFAPRCPSPTGYPLAPATASLTLDPDASDELLMFQMTRRSALCCPQVGGGAFLVLDGPHGFKRGVKAHYTAKEDRLALNDARVGFRRQATEGQIMAALKDALVAFREHMLYHETLDKIVKERVAADKAKAASPMQGPEEGDPKFEPVPPVGSGPRY